ncbi:MAG: hypothetical protein R6V46_12645 [Desulfatiglandaceae bacterium]
MDEANSVLRQALMNARRVAVLTGASLALEAKSARVIVGEINLEKTSYTHIMDHSQLGKAGEILPKLMEGWN